MSLFHFHGYISEKMCYTIRKDAEKTLSHSASSGSVITNVCTRLSGKFAGFFAKNSCRTAHLAAPPPGRRGNAAPHCTPANFCLKSAPILLGNTYTCLMTTLLKNKGDYYGNE